VARLQIGVVVRELERSPNKETVGGVVDYWFRVATSSAQEGWVFGSFVVPFDSSRKTETYRQIATGRLKIATLSFGDLADLHRFLVRATAEVTDREGLAELELAKLRAMQRAAISIPFDQQEQPPYQTWINAQADSLVLSEPSGQWLVKSALFWQLQKKYSSLPIAEQIAWEGARNSLPGECEGYLPCHFFLLNQTDGRYLGLYLAGAHAEEALNNIADVLDELYDLTKGAERPTGEERADALKELTTLRGIVTKSAGTPRTRILEQINRYLRYYR
jgi:hypothetical protein